MLFSSSPAASTRRARLGPLLRRRVCTLPRLRAVGGSPPLPVGRRRRASWPAASPASFTPVPRACRAALAAYDDRPALSPLCPPYRLIHDRARGEVVLAVRGLGLARPEDYRLLLDAGWPEPFAGGHAHRGLLRAAVWLLDREGPALRRMVAEAGPERCRLVFGVRGPLARRGRGGAGGRRGGEVLAREAQAPP